MSANEFHSVARMPCCFMLTVVFRFRLVAYPVFVSTPGFGSTGLCFCHLCLWSDSNDPDLADVFCL
jgi:hypothetical protein